jgi:hypothetical protein
MYQEDTCDNYCMTYDCGDSYSDDDDESYNETECTAVYADVIEWSESMDCPGNNSDVVNYCSYQEGTDANGCTLCWAMWYDEYYMPLEDTCENYCMTYDCGDEDSDDDDDYDECGTNCSTTDCAYLDDRLDWCELEYCYDNCYDYDTCNVTFAWEGE